MSSDDFHVISIKQGKFALFHGMGDDNVPYHYDDRRELLFNTLMEAIAFTKQNPTEYGVSFGVGFDEAW